jgi:hypothetical protein
MNCEEWPAEPSRNVGIVCLLTGDRNPTKFLDRQLKKVLLAVRPRGTALRPSCPGSKSGARCAARAKQSKLSIDEVERVLAQRPATSSSDQPPWTPARARSWLKGSRPSQELHRRCHQLPRVPNNDPVTSLVKDAVSHGDACVRLNKERSFL